MKLTLLFVSLMLLPSAAFAQFGKLKDAIKNKTSVPAASSPIAASTPTAAGATPAAAGKAAPDKEAQPTEASVLKHTVRISPRSHHAYYTNGKPDHNTWSWTPQIDFSLKGPAPSGSQVVVEFSYPDGKPWISFSPQTSSLQAGKWAKMQAGFGTTAPPEKGTLLTGVFPVRIQLKNELQGKEQTLFTGSYTVKKFVDERNKPKNPKNFEYYAEQDWNLATAEILANETGFPEAPRLIVTAWFRRQTSASNVTGYIFKDGVEVGNTNSGTGNTNDAFEFAADGGDHQYEWHQISFHFLTLCTYNTDPQGYPFAKPLTAGEYEMKVLRDGKLARVFRFRVGANGKIDDGGVLARNGMSSEKWRLHALAPVTIVGDLDGPIDVNSAKTEGYYRNPLQGLP